jgi:hypothetical protein
MKNNMEQEELLESFTFCELQDGKEHAYRVTAHEHQYAPGKRREVRRRTEMRAWQLATGRRAST